jgi:predicted ester cyclase
MELARDADERKTVSNLVMNTDKNVQFVGMPLAGKQVRSVIA